MSPVRSRAVPWRHPRAAVLRALIAVVIFATPTRVGCAPLPVAFEENQGQATREVEFLSRAGGYRVLLTRHEAVIVTNEGNPVRVGFTGAKAAIPVGMHRLPAKTNYLIGSGPAQWHTAIPNYEKVRYAQMYPGIDLIWHGRDGQIEHDFLVAAGADPRRIQLDIRGASLTLNAEGDLVAGSIRFHKPRAHQDAREIACRYRLRGQSVRFALGDYDRARPLTIDPVLSFSTFLGANDGDSAGAIALDRAGNIYVAGTTTYYCGSGKLSVPCPRTFVTKLSPDGGTLLFSTYISGIGTSLSGMALDAAGNIYLAGPTGGSSIPTVTPLPGYSLLPQAHYVAKLSSDGSALLYATMVPEAEVSALAVDAQGAVYLTGSSGGGLPVVNALQSSPARTRSFKTTDTGVTWQILTGDLPSGVIWTIAVDPRNPQILYLGLDQGLYRSTDGGGRWNAIQNGLPATDLHPTSVIADPSRPQTLYLGTLSNGIYKSADGGANWTASGMGASRFVLRIALDSKNPATLYAATDVGLYKSTDAAATWNPTGLLAGPSDTYFVHNVVLDPLTPTTLYAGTRNGVMKSVDGGTTWTTSSDGFTRSLDIGALAIDPVNPQTLYAATNVDFPVYRSTDGGAHWRQGQWPPENPSVGHLLVDPIVHTTVWAVTSRGILVSRDAGATWDLPTTDVPGAQALAAASDGTLYAMISASASGDAFVMKLDPSGSRIVYSTYLGGSGSDGGRGIAVDGGGRAYITGVTSSLDFPVRAALQPRRAGQSDAFVAVLDGSGARVAWSTYFGGRAEDVPRAIALDPSGNVHLAGWTNSSDFPLRQSSQSRFGGGAPGVVGDAFAAKLKGDGSGLIFSTYLGGSEGDSANAVATDAFGNTYAAGFTLSRDLPTVNPLQSSLAGVVNAFVAAWDGQTGAAKYVTYLGGTARDEAAAIAVDAAGNAYVAGWTWSRDFPRKYPVQYTFGACPASRGGTDNPCLNQDAFVAKISPGNTGPAIALRAVTNAATYTAPVAPGELVSLFGSALAVTPATATGMPLPVQLSDVRVSVNGVPAPLLYVSPLQVNAQIPFETRAGVAQIQVTSSAGTATLNVAVSATAPAIFTLNSRGTGPGAIQHGLTYQLVTGANPATAGETVSIYCTGLGAVNPPAPSGAAPPIPPPQTVEPIQVFLADLRAEVTYVGLAPGFAGLYQVNAQIPERTPSGDQALRIFAGGVISNIVTIAID